MSQLNVDILAAGVAGAAESWVDKLVAERVASALADQDPTLWGPQAQPEAARRLSWVGLPQNSRPLLATIEALRAELHAEGIDRVVLAGMGGSSLAPEVICATDQVALTVLDTTDPGQVADALAGELGRTVLVVSSKSGTTVETDSHRRVFAAAFAAPGLAPAAHRVVRRGRCEGSRRKPGRKDECRLDHRRAQCSRESLCRQGVRGQGK